MMMMMVVGSLEREKAEMKREKEQLLQLRTQIIPSDHHC